jgi:hypothetical protein
MTHFTIKSLGPEDALMDCRPLLGPCGQPAAFVLKDSTHFQIERVRALCRAHCLMEMADDLAHEDGPDGKYMGGQWYKRA